jgi:hypothetical protein
VSTKDTAQAIAELDKKLDRILEILDARRAKRSGARPARDRQPLTDEDMRQYQIKFQQLYTAWLAGEELEVQDELEALNVEELRRFADANNLNITSKSSKAKALQLIAARFREKRQLMQGLSRRSETDL